MTVPFTSIRALCRTIDTRALLVATVRAFIVFVIMDMSLEYLWDMLFSIRVKSLLPQIDYDILFTTIYFTLIFAGLFIVHFTFAAVRPFFARYTTAAVWVGVLYFMFTGLLLLQFLNMNILSLQLFLIIGISNMLELPPTLWMGCATYVRLTDTSNGDTRTSSH